MGVVLQLPVTLWWVKTRDAGLRPGLATYRPLAELRTDPGTQFVDQARLRFATILLSLSFKCWDYRQAQPRPTRLAMCMWDSKLPTV